MDEDIKKKIDQSIDNLKFIKDEIYLEKYEISLNRIKILNQIKKDFAKALLNKLPTIPIFFTTNKPFRVGNYKIITNDMRYSLDNFFFSFDIPNKEEYWDLLANFEPEKWYELPDDTLGKVYTTPEMEYLIFTKGDFPEFKNGDWVVQNSHFQPYFQELCNLKKYL